MTKKPPTHAVVLMRYQEESESYKFSLLEVFSSKNRAIAYVQSHNSNLISGDVVVAVPIEYVTNALNEALAIWYVKIDGYTTQISGTDENEVPELLFPLEGDFGPSIIHSAIIAGVEYRLILKCLYDCAILILDKTNTEDVNALRKLSIIKKYIDGKITFEKLAHDVLPGGSDLSVAVYLMIDNPKRASDVLSRLGGADVVTMIKHHINTQVILAALANKSKY